MTPEIKYPFEDKVPINRAVTSWVENVRMRYCGEDIECPFSLQFSLFSVLFGGVGEWLRENKRDLFEEIGIWRDTGRGVLEVTEPKDPEKVWKRMVSQRILERMKVLDVGGIETLVLAELGAEIWNINPRISEYSLSDLPPNVHNLSKRFPVEGLSSDFDLTFSSQLLDRGSGLDPELRLLGQPVSEAELAVYEEVLGGMLSLTKSGGLSIHNGNMIYILIEKLSLSLEDVLVIGEGKNKYQRSDTIWILRKR